MVTVNNNMSGLVNKRNAATIKKNVKNVMEALFKGLIGILFHLICL